MVFVVFVVFPLRDEWTAGYGTCDEGLKERKVDLLTIWSSLGIKGF